MKGIILCAGKSTRLYPASLAINKTLLPIYDKPMIYYPLTTLMEAGIKEILIITSKRDEPIMKDLLGDGSQFGLKISYDIQTIPRGTADALIIGKDFIGKDSVCLIFGDNIYFGENFSNIIDEAGKLKSGAKILAYPVDNPTAFGVPEFNEKGEVLSIEEKPLNPKSNYAVTGIYFLDNKCIDMAKNLKPSARGELEITDILSMYLDIKELKLQLLTDDIIWLDTGNCDSLLEASNLVRDYQNKNNILVASPELIANKKRLISKEKFLENSQILSKTEYYKILTKNI